MIDHPRLARTEADEPAISVTIDPSSEHNFSTPSRGTYLLSTRASALLIDELEYGEREEVAPETARTLFLTSGAYLPEEKTDPVDLLQRLRLPDGGKHPTSGELKCVAAYLKSAEIEQRVRWLAEELVEESRLSSVMDASEIRTRHERMNGLRGIAKDL